MHLKSADVVRKISFRYISVPFVDGFTNIFIESVERYFNQIIELNNFSNNVCTFWVNTRR